MSPCGHLPVFRCTASADGWFESEGAYRVEVVESVGVFRAAATVELDGTEVGLAMSVDHETISVSVEHRPPRGLKLRVGGDPYDVLHNGTDAPVEVVTFGGEVDGTDERWDAVRGAWVSLGAFEHCMLATPIATRMLAPGESVPVNARGALSARERGWYRLRVALRASPTLTRDGVSISHSTLVERRWRY